MAATGVAVLRMMPKAGATDQPLLYTEAGSYVHAVEREQWWLSSAFWTPEARSALSAVNRLLRE